MISPTEVEVQLIQRVSEWFESGCVGSEGLRKIERGDICCPSATNVQGETVFAVFRGDVGDLNFLQTAINVPEIVKSTLDMDEFAAKNRLAGPCVTSSCHYWRGACQLGFFVSEVEVRVRMETQQCAIREKCRWIKENGTDVCGACAFVRNLPVTPVSL
jgi:hypothetical protein